MAGMIMRVSSCVRDLARTGLKAVGTVLFWSICSVPVAQGLERTNLHGRAVSPRGGIGTAAGVVTVGIEAGRLLRDRTGSSSRAGLVAITAAGAGGYAGVVDDLDVGAHDGDTPAKGLKDHLIALAYGRVTTGALKIAVIGSGALIGGVLLARHRSAGADARPLASSVADAASSAVVIAAWANPFNLPDLRPGRALKTACIASTPLLATPGCDGEPTRMLAVGTPGVSPVALPEDLLKNTMLGGTGANAVGALPGIALACYPHVAVRAGAALSEVSLILASERVSFSRVISETPVLIVFDGPGCRR